LPITTDALFGLQVSVFAPNSHSNNQGVAMSIDRIVLAFAGFMIILSLVLSYFVSPYWLALAAFVGINLFQAAFTGFCPLAFILKRAGVRTGVAFT
jgi:hypothetical protein